MQLRKISVCCLFGFIIQDIQDDQRSQAKIYLEQIFCYNVVPKTDLKYKNCKKILCGI